MLETGDHFLLLATKVGVPMIALEDFLRGGKCAAIFDPNAPRRDGPRVNEIKRTTLSAAIRTKTTVLSGLSHMLAESSVELNWMLRNERPVKYPEVISYGILEA